MDGARAFVVTSQQSPNLLVSSSGMYKVLEFREFKRDERYQEAGKP